MEGPAGHLFYLQLLEHKLNFSSSKKKSTTDWICFIPPLPFLSLARFIFFHAYVKPKRKKLPAGCTVHTCNIHTLHVIPLICRCMQPLQPFFIAESFSLCKVACILKPPSGAILSGLLIASCDYNISTCVAAASAAKVCEETQNSTTTQIRLNESSLPAALFYHHAIKATIPIFEGRKTRFR